MAILINGYTANEWVQKFGKDRPAKVFIDATPRPEINDMNPVDNKISGDWKFFITKEWSDRYRWHQYDPITNKVSQDPVTQEESDELSK